MAEYNQYQRMHYKANFGRFEKLPPYKGGWDLIYMGQYIVKNAAYAICKKAKSELEKNKFTHKKLIIFQKAK